jgi:hypothetical protein
MYEIVVPKDWEGQGKVKITGIKHREEDLVLVFYSTM